MKDLSYLEVHSKEITTKDSKRKFPVYYAYVVNPKDDNALEFERATYALKDGTIGFKTIKVALTDNLANLDKSNFPCVFGLSNDDYFVTTDKDANKNYRLDKDGKKRLVAVIKSYQKLFPVPKKSLTLEDLKDF